MEVDDFEFYSYKRNVEDVNSIIKHAKLDIRNLTEITQAIYFPDVEKSRDTLKLLELDKHLLQKISEGDKLLFKGGLNEKVVLCTEDKTYEIKEAEISNSLLLVPDLMFGQATSTSPLKSPKGGANSSLEKSLNDSDEDLNIDCQRKLEHKNVVKIFHEYLECREIKPRFRKLGDLLKMTRYSGPENEYCIDRKLLFTFDQLLDTVQCSRNEFNEGLNKLRAIRIDGHLRVLEYEYEFRVISLMLSVIEENSWTYESVERQITIDSLEGIAPKEVVEGLFDIYTNPNENTSKYHYNVELVAKIVAQYILKPGHKFVVNEFFNSWQEVLPEGIIAEEKYFKGLGVIDHDSQPPSIKSLSEDNLSVNLHERLKTLFKTKKKWTLDQIEPYMEYFATPSCPVTSILAKHARSMVVNGQRFYVAKHL